MLERNVNKYLIIITGINEKPSGFLNRIVKIQKLIYFYMECKKVKGEYYVS